ncbi:uncharacterized protein RCC_05855 [Ramularia collo-cygni]|uniref:Uncharacterized protein n=1 Tax=Ramularia collo-cygni TaxID=112498 RepID=A0A2D3VE51_9PEZI|nr:uncharacterized protein RCC_05855 [Ramularia collo-cygni]CZT19999.1 uncharacterized protein RCC_05855 [Ramularia collo-cygni]
MFVATRGTVHSGILSNSCRLRWRGSLWNHDLETPG